MPKYPGLNTHKRALEAKDKLHGSTIHYVTSELDAGPIIRTRAFEIEPSDTTESLIEKVKKLEHKIYPETISFLKIMRYFIKFFLIFTLNAAEFKSYEAEFVFETKFGNFPLKRFFVVEGNKINTKVKMALLWFNIHKIRIF